MWDKWELPWFFWGELPLPAVAGIIASPGGRGQSEQVGGGIPVEFSCNLFVYRCFLGESMVLGDWKKIVTNIFPVADDSSGGDTLWTPNQSVSRKNN